MNQVVQPKLAVVGAGHVGMICALLACQRELAPEIVLLDIDEGRAKGIALDLAQSAGLLGFTAKVTGGSDPALANGSDLVIVTAGRPRKPGMSRSDLLEVNGRVMVQVAEYVRTGSPEACVICVTNPLDPMTHLLRAKLGFPAQRVLGMAGALDSARFAMFLGERTGIATRDIDTLVLGAHGDSMVPVQAFCSAGGVPLSNLLNSAEIEDLAARTRAGGAEIVKLLGTGSAFFAPAAAAVGMAASILRDEQRLVPSAALLNGEYGIEGLTVGVPVVLGARGAERILELPLDTESRIALQRTAGEVERDVQALRDLGLL